MILSGEKAKILVTHVALPLEISPASIDFRISEDITIYSNNSVLVSTIEGVNMPDSVAGLLVLRTSTFRRGLILASPGWIDPGYIGKLTFRLTNVVDEKIVLSYGDRIIQVIFQMVLSTGSMYDGKYQGGMTTAQYIPDKEE